MHQHFNGQLPMEAVPHAGHIVAQAGLTFAVLVAAFDTGTPMRQLGQTRQWRRGRQIAPIELGLALLPRQRALADEPALGAGLIGMAAPYAQGAELLGQRSRTAPAPSDGVPSGLRLTRQHRSGAMQGRHLHRMRMRAWAARLFFDGQRPGGRRRDFRQQTHAKVTGDAHHTAHLSLVQPIEKVGVVVNSRTLMYQRCAANLYQKNGRTHCESLRS